ncbi:MAG TPA: hypothetical protein VMF89_18650 [Polyangiales bacterium]|nr:hypothetical protein [Polyangiales bacterium]
MGPTNALRTRAGTLGYTDLVTLIRKDGTRFRAEFHTKQSQLGERPIRVVALRDVTQRERVAALLRESEARLRQILESSSRWRHVVSPWASARRSCR